MGVPRPPGPGSADLSEPRIRGKAMFLPFVYVLTLNWNRCQDTLACLESLAWMSYPNSRILVVDNGSTDGSMKAAAGFPEVEIIANRALAAPIRRPAV
jgi:hypothetical protein